MNKVVVEYIEVRRDGESVEEANERVNQQISEFINKHQKTHDVSGPTVYNFTAAEPLMEMRAIDRAWREEIAKEEGRMSIRVQYAQHLEGESLKSAVQAASGAAIPQARPGGFPPRAIR